jgi:hypothetical protein
MKRFVLIFGAALLSVVASAQEPVTTFTEQELSSPGDFNVDGRLDVALVDRASGEVRIGLQQANGSWNWSSSSSGVDGASLLAVGPFFGGTAHAVAVASTAWNRIQLWSPGNNQRATWYQPGLGLSVLAAHASAGAPLLAVTDQNGPPASVVAHALNTAGASVNTAVAASTDVSLAWGNPIVRRVGQARRVAAMRAGDWIGVSPDGAGTVFRTGLPEGSRFVTGRFVAGNADSMAVFWKPGSADVQISSHNGVGGSVWSDGADYAFPQPVVSLVVIDADPQQLLVIFEGATSAALYSFEGGTPSRLEQSLTAAGGEVFTTAVSSGTGSLGLLHGAGGRSQAITRWTLSGGVWTEGATTALPAIPSTAGRANVFFFSAEPLVNPKATLINRERQGDWSSQGGQLSGNSRSIASERFVNAEQGLRPNGSVTVSDPTARFALVNQLLPDASAASLTAGVGAPIGDVTFSPPAGQYPTLNPEGDARLSVTLSATRSGESVLFRKDRQSAWQVANAPIELTGPTALQAYAIPPGGKPGLLRTASYTFSPRPSDIASNPGVDADQNGLADAWELAFGQFDPNADTDGDGANALTEQNAGTDPLDPLSRPSIDNPQRIISLSTSTGPDGPVLRLDWPADAGAIVLQSSPDLITWTDVVPQPVGRSYELLIQDSRLFFRLRAP